MNIPKLGGGSGWRPPFLKVVKGTGGPRVVLLNLADERETQAFVTAFRQLGWRAEAIQMSPEIDVLIHEPDILMTDEFNLIAEHKLSRDEMLVVAVTNETGERIAYEFGADFVIVRPINFADPLGMNA